MWKLVIEKLFISPKLMLGYFGVMIFMVGEGLEQNWLSPYLQGQGLTIQQTSLIFTVYGLMAAISSWLSGVLAEVYGVRRVMSVGLVMFCIGSFFFLMFGIPSHNLSILLPTYALRGLSYPLFAYGFLVWVAYEAPPQRLGTAVGMFWFVYAGGLAVLGTMYSKFAIPAIGHIYTLWSALVFVFVGAFIALALSKDNQKQGDNEKSEKVSLLYLVKGLTIAFEKPRVGLGGIVRMIDTTAGYGFAVLMPEVLRELGHNEDTAWLPFAACLWSSNVIFNLLFGMLGDKIGWRNVVTWFGCVGCAITTLMLYYVMQWDNNSHYIMVMIIAAVYGACLAAFVPLSAIMPMMAPQDKGAAMSILNFGAGLSTFLGPGIVRLFISSLGTAGVIYIYAGLYVLGAFLMIFVKVDQKAAMANESTSFENISERGAVDMLVREPL